MGMAFLLAIDSGLTGVETKNLFDQEGNSI
jgi:hypothetical protein